MVNGITTIISSSAITEKIADVQGRTGEHAHLATTAAVQEKTQKNLSTVQQMDKAEISRRVDEKKEEEKEKQQKKQQKKKPASNSGKNLDLQA